MIPANSEEVLVKLIPPQRDKKMTVTPLSQHTQIQRAVHSFLLESVKAKTEIWAGRCKEKN